MMTNPSSLFTKATPKKVAFVYYNFLNKVYLYSFNFGLQQLQFS